MKNTIINENIIWIFQNLIPKFIEKEIIINENEEQFEIQFNLSDDLKENIVKIIYNLIIKIIWKYFYFI